MFYHGFDNYMQHAFPLDELRPMSCIGEDSLGGYTLTLVSSSCGFLFAFEREFMHPLKVWLPPTHYLKIDRVHIKRRSCDLKLRRAFVF